MDVSVIMVNYNTRVMTSVAIDSVFERTEGIRFEIIVVDNASSDGSKEYFEGRKDITYIYSDKNLGFGQANNLAAKQAKGKYLFFLNSDTLLCNNAIKILHNYIETHPEVGVVGGNLYNRDNKPTYSYDRSYPGIYSTLNFLSCRILNRLRYGKNSNFNHLNQPLQVAFISGADLMIRADLYRDLDGFSNDYFMYYEETDLCYRIFKTGFGILSIPKAKIIHLEGGSFSGSTENIIRKFKISISSRVTFIKKYHTPLYVKIDYLLNYLYLIVLRRVHKKNFNSIDLAEYYRKQMNYEAK